MGRGGGGGHDDKGCFLRGTHWGGEAKFSFSDGVFGDVCMG